MISSPHPKTFAVVLFGCVTCASFMAEFVNAAENALKLILLKGM